MSKRGIFKEIALGVILLLLGGSLALRWYHEFHIYEFITNPYFEALRLLSIPRYGPDGFAAPNLIQRPSFGFTPRETSVVIVSALFLASIGFLCRMWLILRGAIQLQDRKRWYLFVTFSLLGFGLGCSAGFLLLVPYTLYALATMGLCRLPWVILEEYMGVLLTLSVMAGWALQVPLFLLYRAKGSVSRNKRASLVIQSLIIAAVLAAALAASPGTRALLLFIAPALVGSLVLIALLETGGLRGVVDAIGYPKVDTEQGAPH